MNQIEENIFKPVTPTDKLKRKQEYYNIIRKKNESAKKYIDDKYGEIKPNDIISFNNDYKYVKYKVLEIKYNDIISTNTNNLIYDSWSAEAINGYYLYLKNVNTGLSGNISYDMLKYMETFPQEQRIKDFKITHANNLNEDIFKPASTDDIEKRNKEYEKIQFMKENNARQKLEKLMGEPFKLNYMMKMNHKCAPEIIREITPLYIIISFNTVDELKIRYTYSELLENYYNNIFFGIISPDDPIFKEIKNTNNYSKRFNNLKNNLNEDIFKPANSQEIESRKEEYMKIQIEKNKADKKELEDTYGKLNINDLIVWKDGNSNFTPSYKIISINNDNISYTDNFGIQLHGPIITIKSMGSSIVDMFVYSFSELIDRLYSNKIKIVHQNTPEYQQYIKENNENIFKPASQDEAKERHDIFMKKSEDENIKAKEELEKKYGKINKGDTIHWNELYKSNIEIRDFTVLELLNSSSNYATYEDDLTGEVTFGPMLKLLVNDTFKYHDYISFKSLLQLSRNECVILGNNKITDFKIIHKDNINEDIFAPASSLDIENRTKEYNETYKQKFIKKYGNIEPGDVLVYNYNNHINDNMYLLIKKIFTLNEDSMLNISNYLKYTEIINVIEIFPSINNDKLSLIKLKDTTYSGYDLYYDWKSLMTLEDDFDIDEYKLEKIIKKDEASKMIVNESEDIFKPVEVQDISKRQKKYNKILLQKNIKAKIEFEKTYGKLEVGDFLLKTISYDDNKNKRITDFLYRIEGFYENNNISKITNFSSIEQNFGPIIEFKKCYGIFNYMITPGTFELTYFNLLQIIDINRESLNTNFQIIKKGTSKYNDIENKIITNTRLYEGENQTDIFKPVGQKERVERFDKYTEITKEKNIKAKKILEAKFGTPEIDDILDMSGYLSAEIITEINDYEIKVKWRRLWQQHENVKTEDTEYILRRYDNTISINFFNYNDLLKLNENNKFNGYIKKTDPRYNQYKTYGYPDFNYPDLEIKLDSSDIDENTICQTTPDNNNELNHMVISEEDIFKPADKNERQHEYLDKLSIQDQELKNKFISKYGNIEIGDKLIFRRPSKNILSLSLIDIEPAKIYENGTFTPEKLIFNEIHYTLSYTWKELLTLFKYHDGSNHIVGNSKVSIEKSS